MVRAWSKRAIGGGSSSLIPSDENSSLPPMNAWDRKDVMDERLRSLSAGLVFPALCECVRDYALARRFSVGIVAFHAGQFDLED